MDRLMPDVISRRVTSSKSSRKGAKPKLMVLHTTEGVMKLSDRALFWDRVPASSTVGVGSPKFREAEKSARYMSDADKPWTQAFYNPVALSIEIEGFASQPTWPRATVREVARWLALWSIRHDIPLHRGRVLGGVVVRRGVITHKALGQLGGGHSDPGTFPVQDAIELAKRIKMQRLAEMNK